MAWRKRQGFNSISFIAAFPNWAADEHGATFANKDGVYLRNAWEKFGSWAPNAKISTAGRRHDHREGHARRAGQPAVRGIRRPRRARELRSDQSAILRESRSQDAAPVGSGLRALPRNDPARQRAVVEALFRFQRIVRALRAIPDRALRRLQPHFQRHSPRLDSEGLQPHGRRIQRGVDLAFAQSTARCLSASRTRR